MTPHLRDIEFVDLLDRLLLPDRMSHLEGCVRCQQKAEALKLTIAAMSNDEVPEPSPLFWEHFSARVRTAVEEEPRPVKSWRVTRFAPMPRWTALTTAAALLLIVAVWRASGPSSPASTVPRHGAAIPTTPVADASADYMFGDMDADEAWAVVRSVADQVEEDEIHSAGMGSRPGSAERAAHALSDAERMELAALIEDEIGSIRASVPSS